MGSPREILDPDIPAVNEARRRRAVGLDRCGTVSLRDFDRGVVETLGAFVEDQRYWIDVPGIEPPPGKPGVLVTYSFPENEFKTFILPLVLIRREDISPANNRWHPGTQVYRVPSATSRPATVGSRSGYSEVEQAAQAAPFDITYTITVLAHYRGATDQRGQVQTVLEYILQRYTPYCNVILEDSVGDPRPYSAFVEAITVNDSHEDVASRTIGFGITLRVEGELNLQPPSTAKTVTHLPQIRLRQL